MFLLVYYFFYNIGIKFLIGYFDRWYQFVGKIVLFWFLVFGQFGYIGDVLLKFWYSLNKNLLLKKYFFVFLNLKFFGKKLVFYYFYLIYVEYIYKDCKCLIDYKSYFVLW